MPRHASRLWGPTLAVLAISGHPAIGQEDGGVKLQLGLTEKLTVSDNAQLSDPSSGRLSASTTTLSFGLSSETRTQAIGIALSGGLHFEKGGAGGATSQSDTPKIDLFYRLTGANSSFAVQANAERSPLSLASPTEDDPDPQGSGTRQRHSASAVLDLGVAAPLGLTLSAQHAATRFSDPDQTDSASDTVSALGHLRFRSGAELQLGATQSRAKEDNLLEQERETTDVTLGLVQPLSPALTLSASIGRQRVDTRFLGLLVDRNEGLSGRAALALDLANGSAGISALQSREPGATRQSLVLDRSFDHGNQQIQVSLGATRQDDDPFAAMGSLRWAYQGDFGNLSLDLGRSIASGGLGSEVTTDRLALGLSRDLSARDRIGLDLGATRIDDSAEGRVTRTDVTASYSRDLGQDWSMLLGASLTERQEDADAATQSRQIFLSVTRNFDLRP